VQIGSGTIVGENSRVTDSVIGKNCKIGSNVNIEGAYLWDNVIIEDGVEIKRSIVANDAVILTNTTLDNGCIVSFGVSVESLSGNFWYASSQPFYLGHYWSRCYITKVYASWLSASTEG
jgi:NDP-sugar pyrophosphorylase family protein